jgi:ribokinase
VARVFVLGNFVQACCWLVPRLPLPGETLVATGLHIEVGGKGLNVAVCLQRLGQEVSTLIGCGNDAAGQQLLQLLEREGVSTQHVHTLPGASGWGSGWIGADGQNAIAVYPGANLMLTAAHAQLAQDAICNAQLVYGQFETSLPAVDAAFAIAHAHGVPAVLNPSPWQTPSGTVRASTHTLVVNETEAQQLLALPSALAGNAVQCAAVVQAALPALWAAWPAAQRLIVTLGEQGSMAWQRHANHHIHVAAPTITAVDTVGAGDAFASGYCAAVLAGCDLQEALVWGNICGAHVASVAGVLDALPNQQLLEQKLLEQKQLAQPLAASL